MTPIVDGIETQYNNQLSVQRINATKDNGPAIMEGYNILGHPSILLIDQNGKEIQRFIGPQPAEVLNEAIQQFILQFSDL